MSRPSPWRTAFARRTYAGGALWAGGLLWSWVTGTSDQAAWLHIRLDPGGWRISGPAPLGARTSSTPASARPAA